MLGNIKVAKLSLAGVLLFAMSVVCYGADPGCYTYIRNGSLESHCAQPTNHVSARASLANFVTQQDWQGYLRRTSGVPGSYTAVVTNGKATKTYRFEPPPKLYVSCGTVL